MEYRCGQGVRVFKRATDIVIAVIGLVATAALFIPVAVGIKLTSPGPVIYRQLRVGINRRANGNGRVVRSSRRVNFGGKPFALYKFRTMVMTSDSEARLCQPADPRITAIGAVLRRSHLDELPQFWNVLKGEMSVIGPRPEQLPLARRYAGTIPTYSVRTLGVRPGITGLAQLCNGYTLTVDDVKRAASLDAQYRRSLQGLWSCARMDRRIIVFTALHLTGAHDGDVCRS
jgi:lipopolysaccharide/colanic/teichoic acid biosynthesis glycosyltransferase